MDSEQDFHLKTLFYQGAYQSCISYVTESSLSSRPSPLQTLYLARCYLALSPPDVPSARKTISTSSPGQAASSISLLADVLENGGKEKEGALKEVRALISQIGEDKVSRVVCATVLAVLGEVKEAIGLAQEGVTGVEEEEVDQECISLLSHLYLLINSPQASLALLAKTADITQDNVLSQVSRARVDLFTGPTTSYQSAYYAFEESGRSTSSDNSKAVAQAAMGNWREAEEALSVEDPDRPTPTTLANQCVIALPSGKSLAAAEKYYLQLQSLAPTHPLVLDMEEKSSLFDRAAAKFGAVTA